MLEEKHDENAFTSEFLSNNSVFSSPTTSLPNCSTPCPLLLTTESTLSILSHLMTKLLLKLPHLFNIIFDQLKLTPLPPPLEKSEPS